MHSRTKVTLLQLAVVLFIGCIWESAGRLSSTVFFVLGTPSAVAKELWILVFREHMLIDFLITGSEAVSGLLIGTAAGSTLGLLLWFSENVERTTRPFVLALGTLPVFAFAPLMIIWFGIGFGMKVAMATFATLFVSFNQASRGATLVSRTFVDMMRGMHASRQQIFHKVIVPGSLDWVLSSMRLNVGFGLLGAFIGEFIAADRGLGYIILRAGSLYNVPRALAAALGITALALMLDGVARYAERHRYTLIQWLSVPRLVWRSD